MEGVRRSSVQVSPFVSSASTSLLKSNEDEVTTFYANQHKRCNISFIAAITIIVFFQLCIVVAVTWAITYANQKKVEGAKLTFANERVSEIVRNVLAASSESVLQLNALWALRAPQVTLKQSIFALVSPRTGLRSLYFIFPNGTLVGYERLNDALTLAKCDPINATHCTFGYYSVGSDGNETSLRSTFTLTFQSLLQWGATSAVSWYHGVQYDGFVSSSDMLAISGSSSAGFSLAKLPYSYLQQVLQPYQSFGSVLLHMNRTVVAASASSAAIPTSQVFGMASPAYAVVDSTKWGFAWSSSDDHFFPRYVVSTAPRKSLSSDSTDTSIRIGWVLAIIVAGFTLFMCVFTFYALNPLRQLSLSLVDAAHLWVKDDIMNEKISPFMEIKSLQIAYVILGKNLLVYRSFLPDTAFANVDDSDDSEGPDGPGSQMLPELHHPAIHVPTLLPPAQESDSTAEREVREKWAKVVPDSVRGRSASVASAASTGTFSRTMSSSGRFQRALPTPSNRSGRGRKATEDSEKLENTQPSFTTRTKRLATAKQVAHKLVARVRSKQGLQWRTVTYMVIDVGGWHEMLPPAPTSLLKSGESASKIRIVEQLFSEWVAFVLDEVSERMGMVTNITGDKMVCTWNSAGTQLSGHQAMAASTALSICNKQRDISDRWSGQGCKLAFHISICTARCLCGNIGNDKLRSFAVLTPLVNLCHALCKLNKIHSTTVLIDQSVHDSLRYTHACRVVDVVRYAKLGEKTRTVLELVKGMEVGVDEWMYQLQNAATQSSEIDHYNEAFLACCHGRTKQSEEALRRYTEGADASLSRAAVLERIMAMAELAGGEYARELPGEYV